ncbi:MAG: tetratricopeptide (TPR) repeat protein [Verrucomicrobiales bacterium]
MSQSPSQANEDLSTYRRGWSALNELIAEGRSFSGNERNCAFLNVRGERFADVSSATGLDLPDDTRAVVATDWDFDGKVDFWITNRTAPRVRFLHNVSQSVKDRGFLGVRLVGKTCTRDAIGARVVVFLQGDSQPVHRTLRAGEGFVSQSSKWLHFGLGTVSGIETVIVHWPGGKPERFAGLTSGGHYVLTQGAGKSVAYTFPKAMQVAPSAPLAPILSDSATRTWIIGRVPMPGANKAAKQPTLLNLWSGICSACASELAEWSKSEKALRSSGLEIVALSVDHLSGDGESDLLDKLGFPFKRGKATQAQLHAMEVIHRTFLELQQPLPVPSSFLLDDRGRLAAIYKGKVSVEMLLKDVALLKADLDQQRAAAVPYPGRWASTPFSPDPNRIAVALEKSGQTAAASAYLEQFLGAARFYLEGQFGSQDQHLQTVKTSHVLLGDFLMAQKNAPKAARVYANLLKLAPKDGTLHQSIGERLLAQNLARPALTHLQNAMKLVAPNANLYFNTGLASLAAGQAKAAIPLFQQSLKLQPNDAVTLYQLAVALEVTGRRAEAIASCQAALKARPGWSVAAQKLRTLQKNSLP